VGGVAPREHAVAARTTAMLARKVPERQFMDEIPPVAIV
jgi:hypothetical protein